MNNTQDGLREEQGRLFEIGFNIGILAYLQQANIGQSWLEFYRPDLAQLQFSQLLNQLIKSASVISIVNQNILSRWSELTLLRGFLGGVCFIREYLQSQDWKRVKDIELLYYQCSFVDENSLNTHSMGDDTLHMRILEQFRDIVKNLGKNEIKIELKRYQKKGEFLKADSLSLWGYRQEYRLLVVDTSIFSVDATQDLANLEFVELIKRQLIREINYLRSKSIFTRMRIDTGEEEDLDYAFAAGIKDYFKAFTSKNKNKESVKLIQAGSYAYSFYRFLLEEKIITEESKLNISAIGYSDRGISSLTVSPKNINVLKNCYEIYRESNSEEDIKAARTKVFDLIKRQIYQSFDQGKNFVDSLLEIKPRESQIITHTEKLTEFANTAGTIPADIAQKLNLNPELSLRDAHAQLIKKALNSDATYLFLTGNPGIGKTTAIVEFLKEHIDEGFLFLYISPRIQVNLDIIKKFKEQEKLCDRRLFCLTSNSNTISNHANSQYKYIVNYRAESYPDDFTKKAVKFINLEKTSEQQSHHSSRFLHKREDTIESQNQINSGVLSSISEAIYTIIDTQISNQIVATFSIQALRKTQTGDTIQHLKKIFQSAYNSSRNSVIPQQLKNISQRIKHIFIMIDEITGSESGVELLHGIKQFYQTYQLSNPQHGFNTKIIVADASIVQSNVIKQHLSNKSPEPDKIFFRKTNSVNSALTQEQFEFQNLPAIVINANSYPAKSLDVTYKVVIEAQEFKPESNSLSTPKDEVATKLERTILSDINHLWEQPGQILVYIQNKQKLQTLLEKLSKLQQKPLEQNKDYLEIKSTLSEKDKQEIHNYQNNPEIKIIFMTSAGSRGLSFPYVKHILVEIPCFQAEQNLMEILQVIYRGRGDEKIDQQEKQLIFYLAEKAIYYPEADLELSLKETILNILNTLLIVKASMMTRIQGAGRIGRHHFVLIPIGGKSIAAAGENFSSRINQLLELLAQEYRLSPENTTLKDIYQQIQQLLNKAHFSLTPSPNSDNTSVSYLSCLKDFHKQFSLAINQGLDQLLTFGKLEHSYLAGSLIIVPTETQSLVKNYKLELHKILHSKLEKLLKSLNAIQFSQEYNDNLCYATREAIGLIDEIQRENQKSLQLEENSQYSDQYYAFPLFTLLNLSILAKYFAKEKEQEETAFRKILEYYVKSLYSVYDFLPIGYQYLEFPFILFRSYTLNQVREKLFTDQYLFNSHELNIVNVILSQ